MARPPLEPAIPFALSQTLRYTTFMRTHLQEMLVALAEHGGASVVRGGVASIISYPALPFMHGLRTTD